MTRRWRCGGGSLPGRWGWPGWTCPRGLGCACGWRRRAATPPAGNPDRGGRPRRPLPPPAAAPGPAAHLPSQHLVPGTPAAAPGREWAEAGRHRRVPVSRQGHWEFVQDDTPASADDFDSWVCRTVLNPGRPLFREARYILAEEPDIHDTALYHAVLAAIAEGNTTRGGIAGYLERKSTDLAHPLGVLHDAGLITHETEAFRKNRSAYRIAEPLLTFYHAIMRPAWGDLERPGRAAAVWRRSQHTFHSSVVGPHFEEICRQWTRWHAGPETHGGAFLSRVASGTLSDPEARLLLFSGAGFSDALVRQAARDPSVQLIGLDRIYHGS